MSTPHVTCTLTIDIPIISDAGCHQADLRTASGRMAQIPKGARVKLRCGRATYFMQHDLPLFGRGLTTASAIEIESQDGAFAVSLYEGLATFFASAVVA